MPYGFYLWTAGQRGDPKDKNSPFVWKIKYKDSSNYVEYPMTYSNWNRGTGEPNRLLGPDACVNVFQNRDYTWNDQPCSSKMCFVCQVEI